MRRSFHESTGIRIASKGLAAFALFLTLLAGPAHAFSIKPTLTELGGGAFLPEDKTFQSFYNGHSRNKTKPDKRVPTFRITTGWFIYRIISISFSGGYMYASGFGLEPPSGDEPELDYSKRTKDLYALTVFPIQADLGLRAHVFRNQWIIPYGIVGADEFLARSSHRQLKSERYWFEKRGWHYGGGVMLLLDVFDKYHADKMEDEWGISDTYLTVDGRNGTVRDKDVRSLETEAILPQHDFSGWTYVASLTFRLKSR